MPASMPDPSSSSPAVSTRRINPLLLRGRLPSGGTLLGVYACWEMTATWASLPRREDMAPVERSAFSSDIGFAEVLRASGQFRYRQLGIDAARLLCRDATGIVVGAEDDPSPFGQLDRAAFAESAFQQRIIYSRRQIERRDGRVLRFHRLVLPLRGDRDAVDMLLLAQDCEDCPDGPAPPASGPWQQDVPHRAEDVRAVTETERCAVSLADTAEACLA